MDRRDVGLCQWMLLGGRRDRTLLWLPVNGTSAFLSWLVGASVGFDLYHRWWWSNVAYVVAAGAVGGAVAGVITGFPLPWLLRRRAQPAEAVHACRLLSASPRAKIVADSPAMCRRPSP